MKLSTRGRYGARAMLDLAIYHGEGPILLKDIARRQHISERYLEHLVTSLKAAGLVSSKRGAHGGFALAKSPSEIRLCEVIQTVEGSIAPVECVDDPEVCPRAGLCVTRDVWIEMKKAMSRVLESITLQDLVQHQRKKEKPEAILLKRVSDRGELKIGSTTIVSKGDAIDGGRIVDIKENHVDILSEGKVYRLFSSYWEILDEK